jgi:hypothetical protein
VLAELQAGGSPEALHLADVMRSIPIGNAASDEAGMHLTKAVFSWQATRL